MSCGRRALLVCNAVLGLASGFAATAPAASAAVFLSTPPAAVVEGEGPLVWTFASDAPGTMWGAVTWRLSTESEWRMCGGAQGSVTLAAPAPGSYWVEIADEVDLAFAGGSLGTAPFTRCSEPHHPALGPLQPVELSTVTVVPPATVVGANAASTTTTVSVVECRADLGRRERLRGAIRMDRHRLRSARRGTRRRLRRRLARDEAELRELACT